MVVTALREELAPIVERSEIASRRRAASGRLYRLRWGSLSLAAGWTGDGATTAAAGLGAMLSRVRPRMLLLLGVAGGLTPGLEAGALIAGREVRDASGAASAPDPSWLQRALETAS